MKGYKTILKNLFVILTLTYTKNLHIFTYKILMIKLKGKLIINE